MQIIDAHCHFWRLSRGDYGWLEGEGGPLAPLRRDFRPADYPGGARLIVVQAAPTQAETGFLLDMAASHDRIAGVVGWVDLADPKAPENIAAYAADRHFLGVRPMLQDIEDTDWLLTMPRPAALDMLAARGLRFDALVTERHLPALLRFAESNPDLPIIVDHASKPQPGRRPDWNAGMQALGGNPAIHCKLSGLLTELSPAEQAAPLDALRPILERLLEWFGPSRLIWGSDWPVLTLAASYDDWLELTEALLIGLSDDEKAAIMGGNAARFYGVAT